MKKTLIFLSLALLVSMISCEPEAVKPVGEPLDRTTLLEGTWVLSKVVLYDADAIKKGFPVSAQQKDITTAISGIDFSTCAITLVVSNGNPSTFTFSNPNAVLNYPGSGSWAFDDPEYPSKIILTSGSTSYDVYLGAFNKLTDEVPSIKFKKTKYIEKKGKLVPVLNYEYLFVKQ